MKKKAELTTQQIVILIVLIISFIVILFLLVRLNLKGSSDEQICYNSVVTKGNPVLSGTGSLNCEKSYVCISADKTCEEMSEPEIKKAGSSDEVYQILADEMANCWWMFGEGKIDYIGDKALQKNYCSICSQIAFDDSIQNIKDEEGNPVFEDNKLSKDELYNYLAKTEMSEDLTYAEYFFGTNNVELLKSAIANDEENTEGIVTFGTIDITKPSFVVMGIVSETGNFYKILGGVLIVAAFATPVGWVAGAIIAGSGAGAIIVGGDISEKFEPEIMAIIVEGDGVKNEFMAPTIAEANSAKFELLKCKDVMTLV